MASTKKNRDQGIRNQGSEISRQQALGFSLYLLKAVLNGRGDEVIDLARTNLFR